MTNGPLLAQIFPASQSVADKVLAMPVGDDGRSKFEWILLASGDLMLGVFPTGDGYSEVEVERDVDWNLAEKTSAIQPIHMDPNDWQDQIILQARDLRTESGDSNPEYDRALVELTRNILGIDADHDDDIRRQVLG